MKKSVLIIILLFISLCNLNARHKKQAVTNSEILSIYMRHTACFGRCPDYSIEIDNNGKIKYTGIHFVKDSGEYEESVSVALVQGLFDKFTKFRVDTCKAVYENRVVDLPGIIYKITYKDKTQSISNAHCGPAFLRKLAVNVDSFAHVDDTWKKLQIK
jgi:hypothetical protein